MKLGKATMTVALTAAGVVLAGNILSQLRSVGFIDLAHRGFDN